MIIQKFDSYPFEIKLKEPFINSNIEISKRQGFIIEIADELGNTGYGEVSPLPGSSEESFESIIPIIKELEQRIIGSELNSDIFQLVVNVPSVEFGISQALQSIFLLRDGLNPEWKFNSIISVNGIIGMLPKGEALNKAEELVENRFKTIKIKVGREKIADDIDIVKTIAENFRSDIKYRLDVNGKWNIDKTKFVVKHLENINVEYLEQPVNEFNELIKLSNICKTPIAADESIRSTSDVKVLLSESNIQYFVLKPTQMGNIAGTIDIINTIEKEDRKVIISSAFESSVGRSALVFLSSLLKSNYAHGLAVASFFSNDIAEDVYPIANGKIEFDKKMYPPKLNFVKCS